MAGHVQTAAEAPAEIALDGVHYAILNHMGCRWRLGSLTPAWREELIAFSPADENALTTLAERGIWLARDESPQPLAAMCCGLGSFWPGMGRELYANFPAARNAMDRIGALADWDILALMDEPELDKISSSRWQIPYLFMLEFAQWSQFVSLGLKPDLICGHSLGELVALCLAGVYSPESAWYLLDTRAEHITALEERSTRQSGMLAVPADEFQIAQILQKYPELKISNRNTPRQYILGGPREALSLARKDLRRQHVPAILLNIGLAFHNPAMRVLRDLSVRRLNALEMHAPPVPMLSCVTAGLYPQRQDEICRYIADLDENTVDWTASVQAMSAKFGISDFLELGPRETLCGLVGEILPNSICLAASTRGREVAAMRESCARLFVLGHLSYDAIWRNNNERGNTAESYRSSSMESQSYGEAMPADQFAALRDIDPAERDVIFDLIADVTGIESAKIRAEMDLRHDLALRSSRFPLLVREAEQRLGRELELENLLQIVTVADLVRFLAGKFAHPGAAPVGGSSQQNNRQFRCALLERFFPEGNCNLRTAPIDPAVKVRRLQRGSLVAVLADSANIVPGIWRSLASLGIRLAVPREIAAQCGDLVKYGAEILELECEPQAHHSEVVRALRKLAAMHGEPDGIFIAFEQEIFPDTCAACVDFCQLCQCVPWICVLKRDKAAKADFCDRMRVFHDQAHSTFEVCSLEYIAIYWLDEGEAPAIRRLDESADMLALEILYGDCSDVVWREAQTCNDHPRKYCSASSFFRLVHPELSPAIPQQAALFQGECQFSRFADSTLSSHGGGSWSPVNPADCAGHGNNIPWLPLCEMLRAVLSASRIVAPWLFAIGFSDIRIFNFPALPFAITREFRVLSRARPWLPQEGVMTRMCRTELSVRELSPNGRHTQNWLPALDGVCWFAGSNPQLVTLWPGKVPLREEPDTQICNTFYRATAIGTPWRLLSGMCPSKDSGPEPEHPLYQFGMTLPDIAKDENWNYKTYLYMVEGIVQAAMTILAFAGAAGPDISRFADNLSRWRCGAIGFIRFGRVVADNLAAGNLRLQLRRSWLDNRLVRFDAQILANSDIPLLTLHHLEFEKVANAD